jgi:hypothetical protein
MPKRPTITWDKDWKGTTPNPHDARHPWKNSESAVGKEEVEKLVRQGIQLLLNHAQEITDLKGNVILKTNLRVLKSDKVTPTVMVKKGIHQRSTFPHITAHVMAEGAGSLHIWLTAKDANRADTRWAWQVVSVSAEEKGAKIPSRAAVVQGITRKGSITEAALVLVNTETEE